MSIAPYSMCTVTLSNISQIDKMLRKKIKTLTIYQNGEKVYMLIR